MYHLHVYTLQFHHLHCSFCCCTETTQCFKIQYLQMFLYIKNTEKSSNCCVTNHTLSLLHYMYSEPAHRSVKFSYKGYLAKCRCSNNHTVWTCSENTGKHFNFTAL